MAGYGEGPNLPFGKEWRVQHVRNGSLPDIGELVCDVRLVP